MRASWGPVGWFVAASASLLILAGFTQESSGDPGPTSAGDHSSQGSDGADSDATSGDPLDGLEACDLLDDALEGEGFPPGEVETAGGENGCMSSKSGTGTAGLDLQPGYVYDEFVFDKEKLHLGTVNQRHAMQIRDAIGAGGSCNVSMEVRPDSRAVVGVNMRHGDTDEACAFVEELAERLEPMLPGGPG
ncbi:Protein of unknown function [Haloechinothrix alba]|uniref:DUF3558 domain-containing protein n=1 Tax=Haloechinothrix alba TaxID=664784 RepID=A0A238YEJ4_9PSEU|nr:DUF3558 family protein [Haloechinothrix alba]SNR68779.1 Protein of unknown function [Haloechinothrix alba]